MKNTLRDEKLSASQVLSTFGVGAVLPLGNESFMVMGTDQWPSNIPGGELISHRIFEPRLQKILGIQEFRTVPSTEKSDSAKAVPITRFPLTYVCSNPNCRLLQPWMVSGKCKDCTSDLAPARFITVCEAGHIDEFPFRYWAHLDFGACQKLGASLRLQSDEGSSSIDAIYVSCDCGARRSMKGSMSSAGLRMSKCFGKSPWLGPDVSSECMRNPVGRQRTGGDVWYASQVSALSIPPWTSLEHQFVDQFWVQLQKRRSIEEVAGYLEDKRDEPGVRWDDLTPQSVYGALQSRRDYLESSDEEAGSLKDQEYAALKTAGVAGEGVRGSAEQFRAYTQEVPEQFARLISSVTKVTRLREVRVFDGFFRLQPTDGSEERTPAPISRSTPTWLPAMEVLGEGIFIELRDSELSEWAANVTVTSRIERLERSLAAADSRHLTSLSAKYVLLHSMAHALNKELCLEAGYPSASIRERIYAAGDQAGILLYTSSGDSAGSLGGLCAQSEPGVLGRVLDRMLSNAHWCSSDPVCSESEGNGMHAGNLAACHACLLLPETSCESMNVLLDRQALIGSLGDATTGFFSAG